MKQKILIILILLSLNYQTKGAKILGVFHLPSKSHFILGSALFEGLAKAGHNVTMVSAFKVDHPVANYNEVSLENEMTLFDRNLLAQMTDENTSKYRKYMLLREVIQSWANLTLGNKDIQKMIREKERFDAVIMMPFFGEAILGLGHHLGASNIIFSPPGATYATYEYINQPIPVYFPSKSSITLDNLSFFGRLATIGVAAIDFISMHYVFYPANQKILDNYIPNLPPIRDLVRNVSLVLANSHYSIETPYPSVPNHITVGGFYSTKPKALPTDLKEYLDSAKDGVVLFCFGSNIRIGDLAEEKLQGILSALRRIAPVKVLFKSEIDLNNVPENVLVRKWIPQNDILPHPNIKAFVTHAGLGGMTEAITNGVPTLAIPFGGDQMHNAVEGTKMGTTRKLELAELNEETFLAELQEILTNPKYAKNAKLRSALMKDQPIDPLKKAIYWIEHVIKYKGAPHLRNAGMNLTWYQDAMVDIILFIVVILVLLIAVIYKVTIFLIRFIINTLSKKQNNVKIKQN